MVNDRDNEAPGEDITMSWIWGKGNCRLSTASCTRLVTVAKYVIFETLSSTYIRTITKIGKDIKIITHLIAHETGKGHLFKIYTLLQS